MVLNDFCLGIYINIVHDRSKDENALEVDFGAFEFSMPQLTMSSSIGNGLHFVSNFITAKLSGHVDNTQPLVDYLLSLEYQGEVYDYSVNDTISFQST